MDNFRFDLQIFGSSFDWNGTHYFKVNMSTLEGDPPYGAAVIGEGYKLAPGESSEFCLKVETKILPNGAVQITDIRSGRLDEWGYFSDEITEQANPDKLRWIYVDLNGLNGVDFDTKVVNYSQNGRQGLEAFKPFIIRNVGDDCTITGGVLPVDNTVAIEFTNENVAFTVKGAACSYKDGKIIANGKTFIPVKGVGETPTICLDTTVAQGTFLLDKTNTKLTASAKPQDGKDTVMRDIEYIGSGDGVQVTVKINGRNTGGEISGVMGIDPGEKVIVKNYKKAVGSLWEKTTGEWKDGVFTKTFHSEDKNMPFDIVLTCANPTAETNLLTWRGFQMETAFDFGKTTKGSLGLFEADADGTLTIKAQPAGTVLGPFEQTKNYVRVLVSKDSSGYTIKNLELMVFNSKDAPDPDWGEWDADQLTHRYNSDGTVFVTIEAPTDGNLVLNRNGIELGDERETAWDADGHPTAWLKDFPPKFDVIKAQSGKKYIGFTAQDTISGSLGRGGTITIGKTEATAKTFKAADGGSFRGDGKASYGTFFVDTGFESAPDLRSGVAADFTKKVSGFKDAVVGVWNGEVFSITGLTAGNTVTIQTKNENGVLTQTETYTAKAVTGSTALDIEYKVDGVTMSTYTVPDAGTNIAGVEAFTYTEDANVDTGKMTYQVTTNGDTVVVNVRDGEVIGISGLTSGHGEVAITDKITTNIGSYTADGFTATGMAPNTTVKTLPLKQKQTVQFGDKKYKAGADGAITYQVTDTGEVRFVDGTLKLWDGGKVPDCEKSLTTRTTDVDGNIIETRVDFSANDMPGADTRNIVVTVQDGKVTGITSFGANANGAGETVTITTKVNGVEKTTVTYQAALVNGKIRVTCTDDIGNAKSFEFPNAEQNILDASTKWKIANQVTVQEFNWNNTGYFYAVQSGNVYTPVAVGTQGGNSTIDGHNKDEVYLEVVSATDENGIATVSSMRLVKVQKDGTFAAFTGTIGAFEMEAYGLSGVVLPKHTANVTVKTTQRGVFTGLNNNDVVQIEAPVDGLVTVNKKQFTVKTTEAPGNFDEKCTIRGDGVLTQGVFTVTGEAAASAVPPEGARLNKSISYTYDKNKAPGDGVTISVREHWGIERVTDLEAGEEVTIFSSYQGGTSVIRADVDPTNAGNVIVTKTETYGGQTLVSTIRGAADAICSRNVNAINDFTVTSLFDYGAANGGVGLFLVDSANKTTTVKTQTAGVTFDTDGALYLAVAATKNRNDVTITNLDVLSYDAKDLLNDDDDDQISEANKGSVSPEGCFHVESFNEIGAVDIAAPEGGNLTLKNGAINLGKTPRTAAIHVTGAQAGRSYSGFLAIDTVSTGADTLDKNQKLTVNGVTFTAAEKDRFTVSGDGKAVIDGTFAIGSKLQTAGDGFTQTISGAVKAVVQVRDGRAKKLVGLQGGQKVTVVTNEGGVVITDEFSAVAVKGSASLDITHKQNGLVVESYTIPGSSYNAMGAPTVVADFDWTTETEENGTGYFLVEGLTQESLDLGTVTILPTTTMIFTSDEGSYYLKTDLSEDGVVSGLSLVKIDAEGHIVDSDINLADITKGTLNIEAPTATGLQLDRSLLPLTVTVNIAGAANDSAISNLYEGDSVSTANLAADDTITLNTQTFTAAGGVLNIECGNAEFIVKEGALQLNHDMLRVATTGKTADGKAVRSNAEYVENGMDEDDPVAGVSVTMKNGEVTGVSGLDWVDETTGEAVTVTRTVGDVTTTMTYTAAKCTELGKDGWVEITRTDATGSAWKYVTADRAENILALSENQWTVTNLVTERNFDGKGVGYFLVNADGTMETAKPQREVPYTTITGDNKGEIYLKVTSEPKVVNEDGDEAAYITGLSFVQVQENGTFAETVAPQNFQGITLDVDQAVGFALPPHTEKVAIINAKDENGFAGLNAADTVSGIEAGTVSLGTADTKGNFKATSTFTVAWAGTDDPYTINGAGEIVEGVFEITGKATAAANPATGHECNKSIAYTYDKNKAAGDGVVITVDDEWGIERITGLEAGETVTITGSVKGNGGVYTATDAGEGKTTVTRTETHNGMTIKYTMTGDAATISATNVNAKNGFTVANKFDFNATKDGELGFFALDDYGAATIETQQAGVTFGEDGAKYVGVVAKKSGSMATITHIEAISFDADDIKKTQPVEGGFENALTSVAKTLTVKVPKGLGLTLAKDAVLLRKIYDEDNDGAILHEDTERTTKFDVYAEGGNSFIGFDTQDTITVTLDKDATLTVGADTKTATKFTAKAGDATIRGDGKALNGVFALGTGFETVGEYNDGYNSKKFTKKITGTAKNAVLTIVNGDIASVTGLAAGQNFTVAYTELDTGVVQTITYKAEAISGKANANKLKITCTQTNAGGEGLTTIKTAILEKNADVWDDYLFDANMVGYAQPVAYGGNFDWTMANSIGCFATAITRKNPTSKDIGVVDVKPMAAQITEADMDDTFLVVGLSGNGQVGTMGLVTAGPNITPAWDDDITGTVNFTAPAAEAMELLRGGPIPDGVRLRIADAVDGSSINGLKNGDVVSTTKLRAGDTITVNYANYTAGTADLLRVEIVGGEAALSDGTLKYEGVNSPAIRTTNGGTYSVVGDAVVKVLGGEVVSLSGLTGNVTVVDKDGNTAHYTSVGVVCDTPQDGTTMKTAALNAGDSVSVGTRTYTAGGGSLTFGVEAGAPTLVDGVLLLEESAEAGSNEAIVLSGNREITFTKVAVNSRVLVTVRNGEVASITGLHRGDIITVGDTVYTAETNTIVTMKAGSADAVRAYMNTAGGDVVNANYLEQNAVPAEGQFSWADVSGRSTGYFAVSGNKATIAEQAAKSAVTLAKGTVAKPTVATYVVANTVQPDGSKLQVLSINAIEAKNDGSGTVISRTGRGLLENATLTVTAPTTAGMKYTKHDNENFHITIDKAAAGSRIINLEGGDSLKTNTLEIGQHIFLSDDNSERYIAGAKGTLEFQGEGDISAASQQTTLLKGTILLDQGNTAATLSGSKDDAAKNKYNLDDNITVTAAGLKGKEKVTVVADNGVVKSVTGLWSETAKVTLTVAGDMTGEKTVVYEVLRSSKDAKTGIHTALIRRTEGGHVSYGTFTEKQSFYAAPATVIDKTTQLPVYAVPKGYQALAALPAINEKELWASGTQTVYIRAQVDENGGKIFGVLREDERASVEAEVEGTDPEELLGRQYIAATVQTTNSVANITKLELVEVGVNGKFTAVKDGTTLGRVFVDGTMSDGQFVKFNKYAIPKNISFTASNVALGSSFTGLKDGDCIDTAASDGYALSRGDVMIYNCDDSLDRMTAIRKVTYTPGSGDKTAAIIVTSEAGVIEQITGLDKAGESVTIVETTATGTITTEYKVTAGTTDKSKIVVTKTIIDTDGNKEIKSTGEIAAADGNDSSWVWTDREQGTGDDLLTENRESRTTVFEFDWTMAKKDTGYFAVTTAKDKSTSAAVKTMGTTTLNPYTDAKKTKRNETSYLAVHISDNGVLDYIEQVRFNSDPTSENYNTLVSYGNIVDGTQFTGTINVTAPTAIPLTFDRSTVGAATIADTAKVSITGAAAGSKIMNLVVGDTVTTAKLNVADAKKDIPAQSVIVDVGDGTNGKFTAGAAGALSFRVEDGNVLALTGGTIVLDADSAGLGGKYAYVGTKLVTVAKGDVTLTVTNNGKAYTIGGLKEGETFTVEDFATGTVREYKRSATTLFCTTTASGQKTTSVYNIGAGVSVTSAILEGKNGWTTYTDANKTFNDDNTLVGGKAVTVDLAALDKRIAADGGYAGGLSGSYQFVIDKYMADPKKFAGAASIIRVDNRLDVQQVIGSVATGYTYKADLKMVYEDELWNGYPTGQHIAQTIKAADKWEVHGSDLADTIIGAAKGEDTLIGGKGDDTLTGGGANDTFVFDFVTDGGSGNDTVKSYAAGKDGIFVTQSDFDLSYKDGYFGIGFEKIELVANGKSADVLLHDGSYNGETAGNSVLLVGMGNGQAVTINGENYYFGSATTTKGMTFTYKEGAYYLANGNATTANTLTVGTDSTKATAKLLGDKVEVDLSDTAHYRNIDTVDASKSGNDVILTADGDGSTLKGGTYKSTLKAGAGQDSLVGGSGEDVFWFDTVEKNDTVTGYTSGKDSLYLGDFDKEKDTAAKVNGLKVETSGNDVVFSNGDLGSVTLKNGVNTAKPITIRTDKEGTATADYYVGKAGTYDKKGKLTKASNTFTANIGTEAEIVDGNVSLKTNYYVGNDTANDTLKLVGKDTKKMVAKVSLADLATHASSIDILDASWLTSVADSKITLEGKKEGTFTLMGSSNAKVKETFDLSNLLAGDNAITLTNLDVGEVIELAAGLRLENVEKNGKVVAGQYSITDGSFNYGTLTISGATTNNAFGEGVNEGGKTTYTLSKK